MVILQCFHFPPSSICVPSNNVEANCCKQYSSIHTPLLMILLDSTRIWDSMYRYTGMVRLQDGYYAGQGRVEIYCNGQWGAVCYDDGFTGPTASTVCTQLGYNDYSSFIGTYL